MPKLSTIQWALIGYLIGALVYFLTSVILAWPTSPNFRVWWITVIYELMYAFVWPVALVIKLGFGP